LHVEVIEVYSHLPKRTTPLEPFFLPLYCDSDLEALPAVFTLGAVLDALIPGKHPGLDPLIHVSGDTGEEIEVFLGSPGDEILDLGDLGLRDDHEPDSYGIDLSCPHHGGSVTGRLEVQIHLELGV